MKLLLIIWAFAWVAISCNNTGQKERTISKEDSAALIAAQAAATGIVCFAQQNLHDTIALNLVIEGNRATGSLTYLFKEKDSNRGQIAGIMSGDTLIADYTFFSEGISSIRQVAFLIDKDKATEGYADLEQKDGRLLFKDISAISFGKGLVMKKVQCK